MPVPYFMSLILYILTPVRRALLLLRLLSPGAAAVLCGCILSGLFGLAPVSRGPFAVLLLGGGGAFVALLWPRLAGMDDWFRAAFLVTSDGLAKILPSGERAEGKWSELTSVCLRPGGAKLEFASGTSIDILSLYPFYHQLILAAARESGSESVLSAALERRRAGSMVSPRRLYVYGQLLAVCVVAASAVYLWVGERTGARTVLLSGVILSPLLWVGTWIVVRLEARKIKK